MIIESKGCMIEKFQELIKQDKSPILAHQVNAQGKMGSGAALAIKNSYPSHYHDYMEHCDGKTPDELIGGIVQTVVKTEGHHVAFIIGLFGQLNFGRDKDVVYTEYSMLRKAFHMALNNTSGETLVIPKYIGCGLANGDWNVVEGILEDVCKKYNCTIHLVEKV